MSKTTTNRKSKSTRADSDDTPRHGFYSELFTPEEQRLLDRPQALEDEQKLLRTCVLALGRRMGQPMEPKDELSTITALARLIQMIATLERVRLLVHSRGAEADSPILQALAELDPYEEL